MCDSIQDEESAAREEWRARREARREIVRGYLDTLDDSTVAKVCYLFSRGHSDKSVMQTLKLDSFALGQIKGQIAEGLRLAGIEPRK